MENKWSVQARYLVLVLILLFLGWLVFSSQTLIRPLVVAALLAFILHPAVALLHGRLGLNRRLAVALVYVVFLAILAAVPAVFTPIVINQINSMNEELLAFQQAVEDTLASGQLFGIPLPGDGVSFELLSLFGDFLNPQSVIDIVQATTENVVWVILIVLVTFYILRDWERMRAWLYRLAPEPYQEDLRRLFTSLNAVWQVFLRGQLLSMLLIGLMSGVAAVAIGMPGATFIGLLAAAFGVLPSMGSTVMVVLAPLIAIFTGSTYIPLTNFWFAVLVAGVFILIHLTENYWLRPRILGQGLRIHPALIVIGVVGSLALSGILLALTVVPLLRSAEIIGTYLFRRILGEDPWPDSSATNEPKPRGKKEH